MIILNKKAKYRTPREMKIGSLFVYYNEPEVLFIKIGNDDIRRIHKTDDTTDWNEKVNAESFFNNHSFIEVEIIDVTVNEIN